MGNTFQLEIITPTKIYTEGQISYLRAQSLRGQFGIMAKHVPATIVLGIGHIKIVKDGKDFFYATNGGFADIQSESVLLLLETVEKVDEIDINRAEESKRRSVVRLNDKSMDQERIKLSISRANNRISISKKYLINK